MPTLPDLCFISPPIIEGESQNATLVLDIVKEAAADLYNVEPPKEPITESLVTASLVIIYLGNEPWNPYTLIEIGYRMGEKKPLIVLTTKDIDLLLKEPFRVLTSDLTSKNTPRVQLFLSH